MASSVGRRRRPAASPSIKDLIKGAPGSVLDALFILAVGLGAGLVFGYSTDAREWAIEALGFGWIPVGLWLATALVTLRYNRRIFLTYWRRWTAAAAAVAIVVGALSTVFPSDGILEDHSLGGKWGMEIGGTPLVLTAGKLLGLAVLTPLLLWPRRIGWVYLRNALKAFSLLQFSLVYFYMGCHHTAQYLDRRFRKLRYAMYRNQRDGGRRFPLFWRRTRPVPISTTSDEREEGQEGTVEVEDLEEWEEPQPGVIPTWDNNQPGPQAGLKKTAAGTASAPDKKNKSGWRLPAIDVLSLPDPHPAPEAALQQMARLVETTLGEHGVRVEVTDIKSGPRIVRFGLVPGWMPRKGSDSKEEAGSGVAEGNRIKVQSILTREKDMALALKTPYLRMEAPVPGEALVGLEVPSPSPSKVHLREVMENPAFTRLAAKGGLPLAMGQDTGGSSVVLDLAALPHILITGTTGSGKSVLINSIVAAFLLTKTPEQLRVLMVDPKRVELTPFNGIPHLIAPVIVDADEVNGALKGLIREMLGRYKLMEELGARNIDGYNQRSPEKMPYLVLIVDELADLMMVGGFEVEQNLVRLAQLGRATGIHLVLATQRPSVNVVTGLLKANIAARVAFAVASQVDSRVILDAVGAEKLLGKGDMLLLHNESPKARRVQGTLVYDEEIDQMVEFWVNQQGPPIPPIDLGALDDEEDAGHGIDGHLMEEARELAARNPDLTASYLERRLKIGGRRASEIIEVLEEEGFLDGR